MCVVIYDQTYMARRMFLIYYIYIYMYGEYINQICLTCIHLFIPIPVLAISTRRNNDGSATTPHHLNTQVLTIRRHRLGVD